MNIYDTKMVICTKCKKTIGEIDFEATAYHILCRQCTNPPLEDKMQYHSHQDSLTKTLHMI